MTEPESWTTKNPNTVQVKYSGIYGELMQDVLDWVMPLMPEDASVLVYPMGNVSVMNGAFEMPIAANQYVYLDEDGFHSVSKGAFEMSYRKDAPVE